MGKLDGAFIQIHRLDTEHKVFTSGAGNIQITQLNGKGIFVRTHQRQAGHLHQGDGLQAADIAHPGHGAHRRQQQRQQNQEKHQIAQLDGKVLFLVLAAGHIPASFLLGQNSSAVSRRTRL